MNKYTEKVICALCSDKKEILLKNLPKHNQAKHGGAELQYKSTTSKDISSMSFFSPGFFSFSHPRAGDSTDGTEPDTAKGGPSPAKVPCLRPEKPVSKEVADQAMNQIVADQSMDQLSRTVSQLANQIQNLTVTIQKENPASVSKTSPSFSNTDLIKVEEKNVLIKHARGVDGVLKWLDSDIWILAEAGLQCIPCSKVVSYDYIAEGTNFADEDRIPRSFANFKTSILRHMESANHLQNCEVLKQKQQEEKNALKVAEKCALTCASAAYTTLYFAESRLAYEYHITDIFTAGGKTGSKNHSRNFPGFFLPHIYDVIRSDVKDYVLLNDLPFGIIADKMTTSHLTRHMMGIRVPIWDIRCSNISRDVYLQSNPIANVTGQGVTSHIVKMIESFGIEESYQRKHISGAAMDGQYINLNVSEHLSDIFLKDFHVTWDPAHKIELSIKDTNPDIGQSFVESTSDTIQTVTKLMSYGKSYMEFLTQSKISDHFLTPKIFKSMKFVGHCSSVLKAFKVNFLTIIRTLGKLATDESTSLQETLMSVSFVFDFLIMTDIMELLCISSKCVQRSSNLPWEYTDTINNLISTLQDMKKALQQELELLTNVDVEKDNSTASPRAASTDLLDPKLFPNFYEWKNVLQQKSYQDCPLPDSPISTARTRSRSILQLFTFKAPGDKEKTVVDPKVAFMQQKLNMYIRYVEKLIGNICDRFLRGTSFDICIKMGMLFNFEKLVSPEYTSKAAAVNINEDEVDIEKFEDIISGIHFAPKKENKIKDLFFEVRKLHSFAHSVAHEYGGEEGVASSFTKYVLKSFVNKNGDKYPELFKFLSFVVSFPTSEAIVESWGSVLDHLYKNKPHTKEVCGLEDTGTNDKLTFIKLNGPKPGAVKNERILKAALNMMYKGNFAPHFIHIGEKTRTTSLVVERIRNNKNELLPCFL